MLKILEKSPSFWEHKIEKKTLIFRVSHDLILGWYSFHTLPYKIKWACNLYGQYNKSQLTHGGFFD
jgi:hypothetical protein